MSFRWFFVAWLALASTAGAQSTWYVDQQANGAKTGTNWADAFATVQDALSVASSGDAVWIARGEYRPDDGTLNRALSFRVPAGVAMHGGFAGTESVLSQRDIAANPTTLTGDLLGNDVSGAPQTKADNSDHVVVLLGGAGTTGLSGVTVSAGRGDDGATKSAAGIAIAEGAVVQIDQCVIHDNAAVGAAGGLSFLGTTAVAADLRLVVTSCVFSRNVAQNPGFGGAAWIDVPGKSAFVNCRFVGNAGALGGGAIMVGSAATVLVTNSAFSGNVAYSGSAIRSLGELLAFNSTFSRNRSTAAQGSGGAILGLDGSLSIHNSVLSENTANGDLPGHVVAAFGVPITTSYCCMFPQEDPVIGTHHVFGDPNFVDPVGPDGMVGTVDDDLDLSAASGCIDAGSSSWMGSDSGDFDADGNLDEPVGVDLAERPRLIDRPGIPNIGEGVVPVDIGAYEVSNWSNLGHGLEGTDGVPNLLGHGDWFANEVVCVTATNCKRNSLAALVLGGQEQLAPFKGGTLVPQPVYGLLFATDAGGELQVCDQLPSMLLSGARAVMQLWILDSGAPQGVAATACLAGAVD